MDDVYFYHASKEGLRLLRKATTEEQKWYRALAHDLNFFQMNVDRFERVHDTLDKLREALQPSTQSNGRLERELKSDVANFLYAFNEFQDHWKRYIVKRFGKKSDYYSYYEELINNASASCDEYAITHALRNFQHAGDVLGRVSSSLGKPTRIFANRDWLLSIGNFEKEKENKIRISKQPEYIELLPLFEVAAKQLERIEMRLMFYDVTPELENRAIQALEFREKLCGGDGALILGEMVDEEGNSLETEGAFSRHAQNHGKCTLLYENEIPWGICKLLKAFQGTDYKHIP